MRQLPLTATGKITHEMIAMLEEALIAPKGNILIDLDLKADRNREVIDVVKQWQRHFL
ncbi:hypothetical protein [Dyadobacter bucti]|uniref:hypothetical protein n=1 Tax=Dyadobacter bucti TaxID=2572203 RepID=UPI003F72B453